MSVNVCGVNLRNVERSRIDRASSRGSADKYARPAAVQYIGSRRPTGMSEHVRKAGFGGDRIEPWMLCPEGPAIDDEWLQIVAEITDMKKLYLGWTDIGDAGLAGSASVGECHVG